LPLPAPSSFHAPISIHAIDSQSVSDFFNANDGEVVKALNQALKRGAHLGQRGR
jgi:hypothetical protein